MIRRYPLPDSVHRPLWLYNHDSELKVHPEYRDAKTGNIDAAIRLVSALPDSFFERIVDELPHGAVLVAPHARELGGDNALPQVFATACAVLTAGTVETDLVQVSRVFHTGADPMERLALRPRFEGIVTKGKEYVLVDDVANMGGTLAELANYLQNEGGRVVAAVLLVNAGRVKYFHPPRRRLTQIEERYGDEITRIFGIEPRALTANEAEYLIGFRSADEIRNRLFKARKEIDNRLRSKGIFSEVGSGLAMHQGRC